eukprot:1153661_1
MGNRNTVSRQSRDFSHTANSNSSNTTKKHKHTLSAPVIKQMKTIDFLDEMISALDQELPAPDPPSEPNYELKKKIRAYNTNDFDECLGQIEDEFDGFSTDDMADIDYVVAKQTHSKYRSNKNMKQDKSIYVQEIKRIQSLFRYSKQLGKGGTCRVLLVHKKKDEREQYALKELSKNDKYNESLFAKEIQLLQLLNNNVNVVDFYAAYQTKVNYFIATTYCSGGTFLDRVLGMKKFSEQTAIKYIYIILSAVDYMHSRGIVHRDLKLNNMVFDKVGDDAILKIIDFGDGDVVSDKASYKELVGTLYYLSPECKRARKGWEVKKSDMWSIGIICYILLSGKLPFSGSSQGETVKFIQKAKFQWPENVELSDSCKSFIKSLLTKSTKRRLSAKEALKHEWISDYEHKANDVNLLDKIKIFLRDFNYNNKLHKILVNACLEEIDDNEVKVIVNAFHTIDVDKKGNINESDICKYLMLNSNVNKTYNDNNNAEKHAQHIFNVIEKSTKLGHKISKSKSIPIQAFVEDITTPGVNDATNLLRTNDSDDTELKSSDDVKTQSDGIAVATFKNIMHKSQKKYPVDTIVKELDPQDSGFISFQSISKFKRNIKTISYNAYDDIDNSSLDGDIDVYQ